VKYSVFSPAFLALGIVFSFLGPAVAADDHKHEKHAHESANLHLNKGAKWETDAPLRKGMEAIRRDVEAALPKIHNKSLSEEEYVKLADGLLSHVQGIMAECKLPPENDAQLHIVLEKIIAGSDALRAGQKRSIGAKKIVAALDDYGKHFNHPDWKNLPH
jgi:hypothetical protein